MAAGDDMLDEAQIRVGHLLMEVGGLRFDATIPVAFGGLPCRAVLCVCLAIFQFVDERSAD
jgi:hypothetical protein